MLNMQASYAKTPDVRLCIYCIRIMYTEYFTCKSALLQYSPIEQKIKGLFMFY